MTYGLVTDLQSDVDFFWKWIKRENISSLTKEQQSIRIQIAAKRVFATIVIATGLIWTFSNVLLVIRLSFSVTVKFISSIALTILGYELLKLNYRQAKQIEKKDSNFLKVFNLFKKPSKDEEISFNLTKGTIFQSLWMRWIK